MTRPNPPSDLRFERAYRRWMLMHALTLPGAALVYALLTIALLALGQSAHAAILGAAGTGALGLALAEGAVWLETHTGLDRLFRRVNMRASIAAERLARDEDQYVIEGVKDVVFEWRHVEVIQRDRDWAGLSLAALTLVSLALGLALSAVVMGLWGWSYAAPLSGLTLASTAAGFALARSVMRYHCFTERNFDPTEILQTRLLDLLSEVKALRRAGVRSSA